MYICIHVSMYVCMYVRACMYVCMYVYTVFFRSFVYGRLVSCVVRIVDFGCADARFV